MTAAEVETQVVWEAGTFVTWGEGLASSSTRSFGVIEEVKRGDLFGGTFFYSVRHDSGMVLDLDHVEVVPGYRKGLDAIPDVNGKLVCVGDWVEYDNVEGQKVPVIVTEVKPQEQHDAGSFARHTGILDLHFSQVSVKGYGSGHSEFWDVEKLNFRGDWSGGRSRDPHASGRYTGPGQPVLRKLDMTEAEVLRLEIDADYREIEELVKAKAKLDTRLSKTQDALARRRRRLEALG